MTVFEQFSIECCKTKTKPISYQLVRLLGQSQTVLKLREKTIGQFLLNRCSIENHYMMPLCDVYYAQVCTEGRLLLEFTLDDLMRIRNWHFAIRHYTEMIPRNVIVRAQDPNFLDQLSKNITRHGMTNVTLNYLRVRGEQYVLSTIHYCTYSFLLKQRKLLSPQFVLCIQKLQMKLSINFWFCLQCLVK